jgi:hypothetical protein
MSSTRVLGKLARLEKNARGGSLLNRHMQLNKNVMIAAKRHKSVELAALKSGLAVSYVILNRSYRDLMKLFNKQPLALTDGKGGAKGKKKEYPADTVIIHQFPRGMKTPSLSMFALKLETWCRACDIKYQNEFSMKTSSQGLIPFITLNGYVVEDSQKCIDYLSKVLKKDLDAKLSSEQRAISRLVLKTCDDSMKWTIALLRFWHSDKNLKEMQLPKTSTWIFPYKIYKAGKHANYSVHTKEDLIENGKKDLRALNELVGPKKFLFSDDEPCVSDFAVFGDVAQIIFYNMEPLNQFLLSECPNLVRHTHVMKSTYWPDWDDHILSTRIAAKKAALSQSTNAKQQLPIPTRLINFVRSIIAKKQ